MFYFKGLQIYLQSNTILKGLYKYSIENLL